MSDRDELLARLFHDTYEKLAPTFGYETREDTKQFDPTSPNGKLMIAVAGVINDTYTAHQVEDSKEPWIIRLGPVRGSFKSIRIVGEKPVKDFLKSQVAKAEREARIDERQSVQDKLHGLTITPENSHLFDVLSTDNHNRLKELKTRRG